MQVNKKYTSIFIDLDNTLWDFDENSYFAMQSVYNQFDKEFEHLSFDVFFQVYSKHNQVLWDEFRNKKIFKRELITKRFQNTFDELDVKGILPERMNEIYLDEMPKQKLLVEGAIEILNYFKEKNYRIYLITNGFREVQHKKLKSSGIEKFFSKIIISEDVKSPKPNREIFEYAVKSANARKSESIMIGDDWNADVLGALHFGIDAVFFDKKNNPNKSNIELFKRNYIYSIGMLLNIKSFL